MALAATEIRIEAPIPGKSTIGIEVPNSKPEMVSMRSLIASEKFQKVFICSPYLLLSCSYSVQLTLTLRSVQYSLVCLQ